MPMMTTTTTGGTSYTSPFVGKVGHTLHLKVDISTLTTAEVDSDGYVKPGVPLGADGTAIGAAESVYGVVVEATKLPITLPRDNTTLAAETNDCFVTVATFAIVNRDIAEGNLGRVYTANELAGFALAGAHFQLTST